MPNWKHINGFKLNARNKYIKKRKALNKAIRNEKIVEKNNAIYRYPLSSSYGTYILDSILPNRCNDKLSVDKIYPEFIPLYIDAKEKQINKLNAGEITRQQKRHVEKLASWLQTLFDENAVSYN